MRFVTDINRIPSNLLMSDGDDSKGLNSAEMDAREKSERENRRLSKQASMGTLTTGGTGGSHTFAASNTAGSFPTAVTDAHSGHAIHLDSIPAAPVTVSSIPQRSQLQRRVIESLELSLADNLKEGKNFKVVLEVSSFGGVYPVDAAVYYGGDIIAIIEVDGPHHYRHDGALRRKDKLKEALYKKMHPDSIYQRIRWDEANKFGSDVVGAEMAEQIFESARQSGAASRAWKSLQRNMADFFSWGLRNEDFGK